MSITMNRVHHASAADQAAKADFTAPVANRRLPERAANSAAPAKQAANRNTAASDAGSGQAAPARSVFSPAPANSAQAAKTTQTGKADQSAEAADEASADTPVAAPFAQILTLADLASADTVGDDGAAAAPAANAHHTNDADGAAAASAGTDTLPAMMTSMLNAGAAPGGTLALAASARGETVSAVSTLSNSATRLNLAAASVAVNVVAPQQAAADAAAQLQASSASGQGANIVAGAAVQDAPARHTNADAPDAATQVPAAATDAAVPQTASATRNLPRGAEAAAGRPADAAPLASAAVAKDENRATAATGTPAATTNAGVTSAAPATPAAATVKLAGTPEQWQQPLRQALGDRLQVNLQRNNDHAVIRLEPPNMGSIEISIRHSAGSLQVNLSANNSEVLRQLNTIGDSVRQDLSTRQFSDVAVTVTSNRAQAQAQDGGGRNGQQRDQNDGRNPGRALSEEGAAALFAMTSEQE